MTPELHDLKPSRLNPGPLTPDRIWTICELVAYRLRDRQIDASEKTPSAVAEQILEVRLAWQEWDKRQRNLLETLNAQ